MTLSTTTYRDLDLNLTKSINNGFSVLETKETIKQSIKNILLTRINHATKFEKPEFGSGIFRILSEKATKFSSLQLKTHIELALENYEPRITLNDIQVSFIEYGFQVLITYTIISLSLKDQIQLNLNIIQ